MSRILFPSIPPAVDLFPVDRGLFAGVDPRSGALLGFFDRLGASQPAPADPAAQARALTAAHFERLASRGN